MPKKKIKAIGMISGGLDSSVATQLIQKQGVEVVGVNFSTGFCMTDHHRAVRKKKHSPEKLRNEALRAGADLHFKVDIIDISKRYFQDVVLKPKHGYGSGMNPCLDCRIYMLKKAKKIMEKEGADFVFTGEVLGQRPMSQYRRALDIIAKESGLGDRLLRPLSAQKLPETLPEKEGWVNREELKGIEGRMRVEQIQLADALGVTDFPQPAGGCCFLPDRNFATKLRDLIKHQKKINKNVLTLLKVGRHFRISPEAKLIVGRDEAENKFLERFKRGRAWMRVVNTQGPCALLEGKFSPQEKELALGIVARYADLPPSGMIDITFKKGSSKEELLQARPLSTEAIEPYRIPQI
ncbi:MAG: thiamine biosynthesis protein [Chlamydiae bacterium]|nr:thiamine biosynthesis protein [Chlamydiota bacterium]